MARQRAAWLAFAGLLALSLLGVPAQSGGALPAVIESGLIALGVWLVLSAARRALDSEVASAAPLRIAVVLLCAIALGQIARSKRAFPWMPYTMYGRAREGDVVYYRYTARHESGATAPFKPSRVMPALGYGRIGRGLQARLDAIAARKAEGRHSREDERLLAQALSALARRYERDRNASRPGERADPLVAIDVARATLPPPYDPRALRTEPVTSIPVGLAP